MVIAWSRVTIAIGLLCWLPAAYAVLVDTLYRNIGGENDIVFVNGVDKSKYVKLSTSIYLFGGVYDHIYINENGLLTFDTEFPEFVNVPFPLEFAAIAPFYSNIDTTNANESTTISISIVDNEHSLNEATQLISAHYLDGYTFKAESLVIATWQNVGHYRENNDQQNTFQVTIICGSEQTFVQFLYPEGGLNWLQGDIGESGLPDVRAQVGFISEDGQFYGLKGSGTDSVKYLSDLGNTGEIGSWLFRVGARNEPEAAIKEPDQLLGRSITNDEPTSCNDGGRLRCHTSAVCEDNSNVGFCCRCKQGYYGNGFNCIKNDIPLRVTGKVTGNINNVEINGQLQSYVVLTDGRSYTAISPLSADVGFNAQLIAAVGYGIGWLFAKSNGNVLTPNGYEITGGKLNHTTTLIFRHTRDQLVIVQQFRNLNAYDQLDVDVDIRGALPVFPSGATINYLDGDLEFVRVSRGRITSRSQQLALVNDESIVIDVEQEIVYNETPCLPADLQPRSNTTFNKVSRVQVTYQEPESALRIGLLHKIVSDIYSNACNDLTAQCGPNSYCVPLENPEEYECQCENGFTTYDNPANGCFDVDECSGQHVCHQDANCLNEPGGYSCRCKPGFYGNGHACIPVTYTTESYQTSSLSPEQSVASTTPNIPSLAPERWLCDQCSEFADCFQGICQCRYGWIGDGVRCARVCPDGYVPTEDECVLPEDDEDEELEVEPFCHKDGCSCPTGYQLHEDNERKICNLVQETRNLPTDQLPCDVENNCHRNANCEWVEAELRNRCVCNPGYEGNGIECTVQEISCLDEPICDIHASCTYDDALGRSVCKCDRNYIGDGRICELAPECTVNEDCTQQNSICEHGICECRHGFERDSSDLCVVAGSCGGAFCAENALCQWDNIERIQFCLCPEGFIGNGVSSCKPAPPPPCNIRNNCGRNAVCTPNYLNISLYECVCDVGFLGDGYVCSLEPNCHNDPNLCPANSKCYQVGQQFQCVCDLGFILEGTACNELPRFDAGFLFLGQGLAIVRVPLNGGGGRPVTTSSMIIGVDKDCARGRIYWSDISNKQILSAKYDGSDKKVFIGNDIVSPEGVAVDWISRHIYWTDSSKDTIEVASLDNSSVRAVVIRKDLVNPRGIAVDPHNNKLYWSDWNRDGPKIEWSNLDGSEREILLSAPAVNLPNSLSISQKTGELCFADAGEIKKIGCIDTYTRNVRTIVSIAGNSSYPFGLAITDDNIYWTDWATRKIESTDQFGNRLAPIASALFGNHKMYGVTAITDTCPLFHSLCRINNGDCPEDTLCVPNSRAPSGRSCVRTKNQAPAPDEHLE